MNDEPRTGVMIRRGRRADLSALGRLGTFLVEAHHAFDPQRFLPPSDGTPSAYARFLGDKLRDADAVVLVADLAERVVGYAFAAVEGHDWMSLRGPAGIVHDLVVDPDCRRRGIGRLLLDAAVTHLESRGVPRVVLSTAERNEVAHRLFASMGFRRTMVEMTRDTGSRLTGSGAR